MTTQTKRSKDAARTPGAKKSAAPSPATERLRWEARATIAANLAKLDAPGIDAATGGAPVGHNEQGGEPVQPAQPQPDQQQPDQNKHIADPQPGQGAGKKAARPTSGKKPKGGKPAADGKPVKTAPAPAAKPAKPVKPKRLSCLDAAAQVIGKDPIGCKDLIAEMARRKLWTSPNGKTPEASLYAAIIREIAVKGTTARFRKVDRGLFIAGPGSFTKKGA